MDQRLLEKYWNAETTPEEEQKLLDEMDAAQGAEATYFKMIAKARQQQSKLCIDDLRMRIGQEETTVTSARTISMRRWMMSAAAVLILAVSTIGLFYYIRQNTQPNPVMVETFEDPHEAAAEVREALAYVSAKLNKSQGEAMIQIKKAGEYAEMFK